MYMRENGDSFSVTLVSGSLDSRSLELGAKETKVM